MITASTTTVKPWFPTKRPTQTTTPSSTTEWKQESQTITTIQPTTQRVTSTTERVTPTTERVTSTTERVTSTTQRTTTTSPTPSTTPKPFEFLPTELPETIAPCEHGQYYAEPGSCTHFLICVNGILITQQCGLGLNWNKEKNMCDWAHKNPCNPDDQQNAAITKEKEKDVRIPVKTTCKSSRLLDR